MISVGLLGEWLMSFQEKGTAGKKKSSCPYQWDPAKCIAQMEIVFLKREVLFLWASHPSLLASSVRVVWAAGAFPREHCHCKPAVRLMGQETLCSQVMVCFLGGESNEICSLQECLPLAVLFCFATWIWAPGCWAFCFRSPCNPGAEQHPGKLQKHLLSGEVLCLGQSQCLAKGECKKLPPFAGVIMERELKCEWASALELWCVGVYKQVTKNFQGCTALYLGFQGGSWQPWTWSWGLFPHVMNFNGWSWEVPTDFRCK